MSMPLWQKLLLAERSSALRYGAAVLLAGASLGLVHLGNLLEGRPLTSIAVISVVLSALYGGMGPALLAAAISAVGVDYFFAEPRGELFGSWSSIVRMLTFGAIGFLIASVVGLLRVAYRNLHAQYLQTEEARRARESTLAMVSHDLRSPLSAVLLGTEYVKQAASRGKSMDELAGALDGIHHAADTMKRLVDDLLDAARIEAGRFNIEPSRQAPGPILEEAVAAARLAADAKHTRIELSVAAGEHVVTCDRQRLTQVLANLIGNAVKFSPEGAHVDVRLQATDDWVTIEVRDSGPGIAARDLPHVFSRYWQAAETAHLGTGLGLFIAKSIIDAHRGRIEVESTPGQGAVFRVHLARESR